MHKIKKTWGYEDWLENNELYCLKILHSNGIWSSGGKFHYHKVKDETFVVVEGTMLLDLKDKRYKLSEGMKIRIKPLTRHRFKAFTKDCTMLEVSTTHKDSDTYYA